MCRRDDVLLISCLGEQTGGGLFALDGGELEQLDSLSTMARRGRVQVAGRPPVGLPQ
jgi:hypothetical protein